MLLSFDSVSSCSPGTMVCMCLWLLFLCMRCLKIFGSFLLVPWSIYTLQVSFIVPLYILQELMMCFFHFMMPTHSLHVVGFCSVSIAAMKFSNLWTAPNSTALEHHTTYLFILVQLLWFSYLFSSLCCITGNPYIFASAFWSFSTQIMY